MRHAIVAGKFYPENKAELKRQLESFLKINKNEKVKAVIVPHAGYFFSGKCAGKAYSLLPASENYIILGVNHSGIGQDIAISLENWETPLGKINNDVKLGREILKELGIERDETPHKIEHSIEVQLPFLQVSQKNFKIVPIILKNYSIELCKKLAEAIYVSSKNLKRKIIALASSDFTHSGLNYGMIIDMKIDKQAIDKILKFDTESFIEISEKTSICGAGAIATIIELAKMLGAKKAELLEYYDSSKIMPSESKVGYASIAFM